MSLFSLRPHQQQAMDLLKTSILTGSTRPIVQAVCGFGKCLGLGTPVMKYDGSIVPVEDIVTGDKLMGPDSLSREVMSTTMGRGQLYRIVPIKGDSWVCNDVHVLTLVHMNTNKIVDIQLDDYLNERDQFRFCHKLFAPDDGIDFEVGRDLDIDPYFLGVWIGDGTKLLKTVGITKPDIEIKELCEDIAESYGLCVREETSNGTRCPTYLIIKKKRSNKDNPLLTKLRSIAGNGVFPSGVTTSSRDYRQKFMAGIIDSDGYVRKHCCEIVQKNVEYANCITFIARSLGLRVSRTVKVVNGVKYQRMGLSGNMVDIPTRLNRKKFTKRRQVKVATRTGFRIEKIEVGEYAGFELSGDGRFLLGDFTVTHNTILAAHIASGALEKRKRIAFCVPSLGLIDQTFERFVENGICAGDMGVIQSDHPWTRPAAPIQICSAQTLARREPPIVDIAVIDECHIRNKAYDDWMDMDNPPLFIGLSATPWAKGMGLKWDKLIKTASLAELIELGFNSKFRVFAPSRPDLSKVKIRMGDYAENELAKVMDTPDLVGDVVSTWIKRGEDQPTLCFAVNRLHAKSLHDQFEACGIASAYIDALTPRDERDELGHKLEAGEIKVICNIGTCTTGIDWDVRCIILARPTRSDILLTQIIGRGLRIADGKEHCIILDFSSTTENLGFVTDIDRDELDMGKEGKAEARKAAEERKDALPRPCPSCTAMMPPAEPLCLVCNAEMPKPKAIEHEAGELVEFDHTGKRIGESVTPVIERLQAKGKQQVHDELSAIVQRRSYSKGWAKHKYKEIFGVWPRSIAPGTAPPSSELLSWIKSGQIRYAKSQNDKRGSSHAA